MARTLSNTLDISTPISFEKKEELTYTQEVKIINKAKYALGILYFLSTTALLTALFL